MTDYQPNSHRSRESQGAEPAREKRVNKVVNGSAVSTRENKGRKLTDMFLSEDAGNVKNYVVMDVLVPAFKELVYDIVTKSIDMFLYGGTGGRSSSKSNTSRISYRSYSDDKRSRRDSGYGSRNRFDYEDIVFESRKDVEEVRNAMLDVIDRYGFVTVSDMYDMCDRTPPFTSNNYGWTSIRSAEAQRVRDGYILKLPKASPID